MDSPSVELDRLDDKLRRLKREYDLFLAGQRRGEPSAFRDEIEREILKITKHPFPSTATRFRAKNLAHRFRALESQLRKLVDMKRAKKRDDETGLEAGPPSVVVDRATLEHPEAIATHVRAMQRALADACPGRPTPAAEALGKRLLAEAKRVLDRPGVMGIRFVLVEDEGGAKIRGEVIPQPQAS